MSPKSLDASRVALCGISAEPLDVAAHEAAVTSDRAGAVVCFAGVVREHDGGHEVTELEYVAHPTAHQVLADVAAAVAAEEPAVLALAMSHRVGLLRVGDVALVATVAAEHRREAFTACARLVDEVKSQLPVWKRQVFTDGSDEWVNCP